MDKLFSAGELICPAAYPNNIQEIPSIEYIQYEAGQNEEYTLAFTEIIFVAEGEFYLSYDHFLDHKVGTGKILLLPPGCHSMIRTKTRVSIFVFRIKEAIHFCEDYSTHNTFEITTCNLLNSLDLKPAIQSFVSFLKDSMDNGLRDEEFLQLKAEELLYLIRSYYLTEELKGFFSPLLSSNVRFHQFVLRSYRKIKTVREFAELCKCSVSNFDRKFKRVFGISAHQWMQQKKIDLLYHEINATDKPFRQIAKEQRFLSLPQFNDYCKKHFGYPPGKMRKLASMFRAENSIPQNNKE